jgi:RNA 2',3'-cyclic 3'-phosphodiesterase
MRLFIGLQPGAPVRAELWRYAKRLAGEYPARYVAPELYHLTLAFLGERSEASIAGLSEILAATAAQTSPMRLTLAGADYFGNRSKAIVYASVAYAPALFALNALLEQTLTRAGETYDDKPFTPHITLARHANLSVDVLPQELAPITFTADRLILFHSTLVNGSLQYLPVQETPFANPLQEEP